MDTDQSTASSGQYPLPPPPVVRKDLSYYLGLTLTGVVIIHLFLSLFLVPVLQSSLLASLLLLAAVPAGILVGICFLVLMIRVTSENLLTRLVGIVVGIGGAIFLFMLTLFAGLIGSFVGNPGAKGT